MNFYLTTANTCDSKKLRGHMYRRCLGQSEDIDRVSAHPSLVSRRDYAGAYFRQRDGTIKEKKKKSQKKGSLIDKS